MAAVASFPAAVGAPRRTTLHTSLRDKLQKTKLCAYYSKGGCQYGDRCAFAHSTEEVQEPPDLRNTRLCERVVQGFACEDPQCPFAHQQSELRSTGLFFKTATCIWHEKGTCRNGANCRFAHGLAELSQTHDEPAAPAKQTDKRKVLKGKRGAALGKVGVKCPADEPMKVVPAPPGLVRDPIFDASQVEDTNAANARLSMELEILRDRVSALSQQCCSMQQQWSEATTRPMGLLAMNNALFVNQAVSIDMISAHMRTAPTSRHKDALPFQPNGANYVKDHSLLFDILGF